MTFLSISLRKRKNCGFFGKGLPVYTFDRTCREDSVVDLGDETHHVIFNASAYEKEKNSDIKDFLSFVKTNTARSDFTRGDCKYGADKKIEQTFLNEYFAINLHENDVLKRGRAEGRLSAYIELIKNGILSLKDAATSLGMTEAELKAKM